MQLVEYYYESGNAPHEALGRAARRLSTGGALYLGGGIGIEKTSTKQGDRYAITQANSSKGESFTGPLSAAMRGFALAGASTASDTPGGATKVTDPAAAARLRELNDEERELERRIARYEARVAAKNAPGTLPQSPQNTDWEARELAEDRSRLTQLRAERKRLTDTGQVEEVEQARPGTNFTKIPAANVKKLSPIIQHYRGMAHPFTACVRDQMKHGLSQDHANRRCAVVKDLGAGTTKWRKGGGKVKESRAVALVAERVAEACGRLGSIDAQLGAGAAVELAERAGGFGDPAMDALGEQAFDDLGLLFLAGHPLGETWAAVRDPLSEKFEETAHPRNFLGRFRKKVGGLKMGETAHAPGGITVKRTETGFEVKGGSGLGHAKQPDGSFRAGGVKAADEKLPSPNTAAMLATMRSLRSRDPKSLGGAKHYQSIEDYESDRGKPRPTAAQPHGPSKLGPPGTPSKPLTPPNTHQPHRSSGVERARREHDQAAGARAEERYRKRNELTRDLKPGDVLAHSGYGLVRYDGHGAQGHVKVTSMVSTPRGSEEKSRAVHPGELSKYSGPIEGTGSLKGLSGLRSGGGGEGVPSKAEYFRLMNTAGALSGERTRKAISDDDLDKLIKGHPVHSPGAKSRLAKFHAEKRRRERAASPQGAGERRLLRGSYVAGERGKHADWPKGKIKSYRTGSKNEWEFTPDGGGKTVTASSEKELASKVKGAGESVGETRKRAQDTEDEKLLKVGASKSLSVPEKHQLRIARQTLRMSDAGSSIMGGMSKDEARKFIRRVSGK